MKIITSKIKINRMAVKAITAKAQIALEQTAEALHKEVVQAQVIPRDSGNLQNESTFIDTTKSNQGKNSIVSSTPYARRLYYHPEYNFKKDENPNAKGHWFEYWQKGGKHEDFCNKIFAENMRRLMK